MGIILNGEFADAEVYQDQLDIKLKQQIINLLNNPISENAKLKFMPDAHPGKFFPIGLYGEFEIKNGIMPSLIGNDAGCGIMTVKVKFPKKKFSFDKLDKVIRDNDIKYTKGKKKGEYLTAEAFYGKGKKLKIENIKNTNVITIRYTAGKPDFAYGVVSSLITNYIELHKDLNTEKSKSDTKLLESEYAKAKENLE
jgi:hypothetical protein